MRTIIGCLIFLAAVAAQGGDRERLWKQIEPYFQPPEQFAGDMGEYRPLLRFEDGRPVRSAAYWQERRAELLAYWQGELGEWPPLLAQPRFEVLARTNREEVVQSRVRVEIAPEQFEEGILLVPPGRGPFPGVVVPFYDPETSVGQGKNPLRDFGWQLARRGFVTLSIGSPGGDARGPELGGADCQPLYYLAYVAANCRRALANLPMVDPERIGIVGHSYGGKWAMFAAAFDEGFACAAWSDPGIVFDETRRNVNYWEPWYLGLDDKITREPGVPDARNPRTGAYKRLMAAGRDLHEVMALVAPRPFLVSGGAEDPAERWRALNHVVEVNELLGATDRVAMTTRPGHAPTEESNEVIYRFFEYFLGGKGAQESGLNCAGGSRGINYERASCCQEEDHHPGGDAAGYSGVAGAEPGGLSQPGRGKRGVG